MTRITKRIAEKCASELLQDHTRELNKLVELKQRYALEVVLDKFPPSIKEAWAHGRDFLTMTFDVRLSTDSGAVFSVNLAGLVPYSKKPLPITADELDKLSEMSNDIRQRQKQIEILFKDLVQVLIRLRTKSRVFAEFPEMERFIPDPVFVPVIDIDSIRDRLK